MTPTEKTPTEKTRIEKHREMADNAINDLYKRVDNCDRNLIENTVLAALSIGLFDSNMSYRELFKYKDQLVDIAKKHIEKCKFV